MANNKNLIVKSNYIVEASYKLSLGEQRIIYVLTSMINQNDEEFKPYKLTVKEFTEILGTRSNNMYSQVSQYVESLRERDLTIMKTKSILKTKWLSSAEYFTDDGYVELCFDPKLKPYLLMLKERFTKLSLDQMVSFKSQYSGRIYEFLKQYEKIRQRIFSIEDLKAILGIKVGEYKLYADFKRKIILKAKKEINLQSDISFEFEEIKTGRKVTSLKFYIKSNVYDKAKKETAVSLEEDKDLNYIDEVKLILDEKITSLQAKQIYDAAKGNIDLIKEMYKRSDYNKKPIKNIVGWLIDAVSVNYDDPIEKIKTKVDRFNDFPQRSYDFEKLESKLLGYSVKGE